MCKCVNVDIGSYDNVICLPVPPHMASIITRPPIMIDACLSEEIQRLWSLGIVTTWSCCGHNKVQGAIGVAEQDISKMKELGYETLPGLCEDSFVPKTIL